MYNMKRIILLLLFTSFNLYSQVGGESIYNFLNLSGSARQAALGGKVFTLIDDVNQPIWNPAAINDNLDGKLAVSFMNYLADVSFATASYAHKINEKIGTFHTSINYLNFGSFVGADGDGVETGGFRAYDFSISIGYSYNIPNSDFYIGSNLKVINSVIENYSSFGLSTDIGILYYNEQNPFRFALVMRNMGYQITVFDEEREKLPTQFDMGASYKLQNVPIIWYLTLDNLQKWELAISNPSNSVIDIDGNATEENISFLDNSIRHFSLGVELFSESAFNIRLGYNFRRAKELMLVDKRTFSGFTAGFGIKMKKIKFDYAFSKYHSATNASTFSLNIDFN
ncbi:hypothetical protein SAMN04488111_1256 [Lutibacter flavus]|uniref:Penicillin-binding protein n=2 Tax=Lutibacter flavus TaxID=691689 RepID=A0A238W102_9FLAO|nr:hypothetical protein SAMN04488111_1256 [Lutibacter flavus]